MNKLEFEQEYLCEFPKQDPACPKCFHGRLKETPLGSTCIGDKCRGRDKCGYKSWKSKD